MTKDDVAAPVAITKRQFLAGMGITAGALTFGTLSSAAANMAKADGNYDVIVMGAGSAGIPAAIFAAERGATVLMIEKSGMIGGGVAYSGGQLSAAGTRLQKRRGIQDSPDAFYDDIMRISHGLADPVLSRLFVDNAAATVDWLEDRGHVALPDHPILGSEHEPFKVPRYIWAHGTTEQYRGIYLLNAMLPELEKWISAGKISVLLRTGVVELTQSGDRSVTGVIAEAEDGARTAYRGKNVLLAAGGCGANPALFEKLHGKKLNNRNADVANQGPYCFHQGKGIELGTAAGGVVRGGDCYSCGVGTVCADRNFPSPPSMTLRLDPATRTVWEIQVNARGERFVREDEPDGDKRKQALTAQPGMRSWIIFDQEIFDRAPPLTSKKKEVFAEYFNGHPMFSKAGSVEELAVRAGIPLATLAKTLDAYNRAVATGSDTLKRNILPLPIAKGPFYAVETAGSTIVTYAGLKVDGELRVVDRSGKPIPNLYAAGEILGMAAISGSGTVGGSALTPALAFGQLLGQRFFRL